MKNKKHTRRKFIKKTAVGTAGLLVLPRIKLFGLRSLKEKSKVVFAHSKQVIDDSGKVNPDILQLMIDQSILMLSEKDQLNEAWQRYFRTDDIIGMKVNGNSYSQLEGTPMVEHFPLITRGILNSLNRAGISESNAIIWERSDVELQTMGYTIQKEKGKLRILGTHIERRPSASENYQPGFSSIDQATGEKTTRLSNILEKDCTALINLPALKSHRLAGITGALKNHYGSIDNPREFHDDDCCNPGVAEINNIQTIREKHKLVICNALMGLWEGGPRWNLANMWMEGSLIFGEDPVAVDAVMLKLVDEKRIEAGLEPVAKRAKHLQLSEEIGLGNSKLENIEIINLTI